MTNIPLPPTQQYVLVGQDGTHHNVDIATLRRWAVEKRITPAHQIYSYASAEWTVAGRLPELSDVLGGQTVQVKQEGLFLQGMNLGCALIIGAIVLVVILIVIGGIVASSVPSRTSLPAAAQAVTPVPSRYGIPDGYISASSNIWTGVKLYERSGSDLTYFAEVVGGSEHHSDGSGSAIRAVKVRYSDGSEEWKRRDLIQSLFIKADDPALRRMEWRPLE